MTSTRLPCPICKKETAWEGNRYRPFCSERCKVIDLGHWAQGTYCVPASDEAVEEGDTADPAPKTPS